MLFRDCVLSQPNHRFTLLDCIIHRRERGARDKEKSAWCKEQWAVVSGQKMYLALLLHPLLCQKGFYKLLPRGHDLTPSLNILQKTAWLDQGPPRKVVRPFSVIFTWQAALENTF